MQFYILGKITNKTAIDFLEATSHLQEGELLDIFLDTNGGETDATYKIIDACKDLGENVRVIALSNCVSNGVSIFLSIKQRYIISECNFCIHRGRIIADCDAHLSLYELKPLVEGLKKDDENLKRLMKEVGFENKYIKRVFSSDANYMLKIPPISLVKLGIAKPIDITRIEYKLFTE